MIELEEVSKYYGGFPAVTDLTFRVEQGEVLGFLGPNGAGKSTTMKMITGYTPPSAGTITVAGYDIVKKSLDARRHMGYLPETVPLYTDMTITEYLNYMGKLRGMSSAYIRRRIDDVIGICRLEEYNNTYIGKLSKGFRQRVGIAQAILHEPDVLVLDEPTIGIDPIQVVETRQLIKDLGGEHTIILSTHILPEVSMICERIIIIHEGQIVAIDTPENLSNRLIGVERIELDVRGATRDVTKALEEINGVRSVERSRPRDGGNYSTSMVQARQGTEIRATLAAMVVGKGWDLLRLESIGLSLEEIFLRLTTTEETHYESGEPQEAEVA